MKKLLVVFLIVSSLQKITAQIVFCPPGAEWHYSFLRNNLSSHPEFDNVPIKYSHDSIIGLDTVHVLKHDRYFSGPNMDINPFTPYLTLIKQQKDSVLMRNTYTHHEWQILYNFACQPGQCWQTKISTGPLTSTNASVYTFCVDSVKYVQHNGHNLKTLFIGPDLRITERYGANYFLFPFNYSLISDGDYFSEYLCYQDNAFGIKQFTSKPCNYSNITGIPHSGENEFYFRVYPNPSKDKLIIETENKNSDYQIRLVNALGQVRCDITVNLKNSEELNLSGLENGMYLLQAFEKEKLIATKKIIKE